MNKYQVSMPTNLRKHIFQGSPGSDFCVKNTISQRDSPCGKRKADDVHVPKKILVNIHPPKSPDKRKKPSSITKEKLARRVRQKTAKMSRKINRVRSD